MNENDYAIISSSMDAATNLATSILNTELNYNHSRQLSEYQNELALENWNKQNQYNSPAAQMQRYLAAGLNPNLMYSQGNSGNATSAPDAHNVGQYQLELQRQRLFSDILDNRLRAQQLSASKQNESLVRMRTRAENVRAELAEQEYNAIQLFMADKLKTTPTYLRFYSNGGQVETTSSFEDSNITKLRNSPAYYALQQRWNNKELTAEKLTQMSLQTQNMQSLFKAFHGNFTDMSFQDFFYTVLRLLAGATVGNMSNNF